MTHSDPVVIKPRQAPISGSSVDTQAAASADKSTAVPLQRLLVPLGGLVLLALLAWVFLILPKSVAPVANKSASPSIPTQAAEPGNRQATPDPASGDTISPFKDLQLERAKEKASEQLAKFVELQIQLEDDMQVTEWGASEYGDIKDLATLGDEQFLAREFDTALATYAQATERLDALRQTGDELFSTAVTAGLAALDNFDQPLAEQAFAKALEIKPQDSAALAGQVRTRNLPELQRLLRRARQLQRRGDIESAHAAYQDVLALDAQTPGIDEALQQLADARTNKNFEDQLSTGFAALDKGQHARAKTAFNAALAIKPNDPVAAGGLQQIAQETEVKLLKRLRNEALAAAKQEDWKAALAGYDSALKIDSNLEFANSGRRNAQERLRYLTVMSRIQSNPTRLSEDKRLAEADELITEAAQLASSGPAWDEKLAVTQALLQSYRKPVAVTLTSDNKTIVTVYKVGRLGSFDSHQLQLRPGAYTIVGSRDGCQDVRKEVIVKPSMPPIEIRCEVRL